MKEFRKKYRKLLRMEKEFLALKKEVTQDLNNELKKIFKDGVAIYNYQNFTNVDRFCLEIQGWVTRNKKEATLTDGEPVQLFLSRRSMEKRISLYELVKEYFAKESINIHPAGTPITMHHEDADKVKKVLSRQD